MSILPSRCYNVWDVQEEYEWSERIQYIVDSNIIIEKWLNSNVLTKIIVSVTSTSKEI